MMSALPVAVPALLLAGGVLLRALLHRGIRTGLAAPRVAHVERHMDRIRACLRRALARR